MRINKYLKFTEEFKDLLLGFKKVISHFFIIAILKIF